MQFGEFTGMMVRNEVKWQILYAYWQIYRISTQDFAGKYGGWIGMGGVNCILLKRTGFPRQVSFQWLK